MSAAIIVRAALDDLCRESGVSPADGSAGAGQAVGRYLASFGGETSCPLSRWLRSACPSLPGAPRMLVLESRVMLRYGTGPGAWNEFVALPKAVLASMDVSWRQDTPLIAVVCKRCNLPREIKVTRPSTLKCATGQVCKRCAQRARRAG